MAKLIYSLDGAFLGEFPLEKERMTIGRRPSNDIHIDNLAISGEHAAIVTVGNDAFIEDLDSTNGTVVNGKAIKKHLMQHGDVIELGKYQLKYINEAVLQAKLGAAPVDYEKTMIIRPGAMHAAVPVEPPHAVVDTAAAEHADEPPSEVPVSAPAPAASPSSLPSWARPPSAVSTPNDEHTSAAPGAATAEAMPVARIQVLNGPSIGKELVLSKALTTLGKPGVQVAVITRRPHGYFVTHVEGARHPVVNGSSVGAQAHQLQDHDVVEIAGVKMEFFFVDA